MSHHYVNSGISISSSLSLPLLALHSLRLGVQHILQIFSTSTIPLRWQTQMNFHLPWNLSHMLTIIKFKMQNNNSSNNHNKKNISFHFGFTKNLHNFNFFFLENIQANVLSISGDLEVIFFSVFWLPNLVLGEKPSRSL